MVTSMIGYGAKTTKKYHHDNSVTIMVLRYYYEPASSTSSTACPAIIRGSPRKNRRCFVLWRKSCIAQIPPKAPPAADSNSRVRSGILRLCSTARRLSRQKAAKVNRLSSINATKKMFITTESSQTAPALRERLRRHTEK